MFGEDREGRTMADRDVGSVCGRKEGRKEGRKKGRKEGRKEGKCWKRKQRRRD